MIVDVLSRRPSPGPRHRALDAGMLTPGLIDLQVNGAVGIDFTTAGDASRLGPRRRPSVSYRGDVVFAHVL